MTDATATPGADSGPGDLLAILAELVAQLSAEDTRRLLIDLSSRVSRAAGGLRLVLAIEALTACASDGGRMQTPRSYERWRHTQTETRPDERPSARFVVRCFDDRWAAALSSAGLDIPAGRRAQQRNPTTGGYSRSELTGALQAWLSESGRSDMTFRAYATWAQSRLAADRDARLALSAPTFRAAFGSWQRAIAKATNHSPGPQRGRDVRSNYSDIQMRGQLAAAAATLANGSRLTRKVYDEWTRTALSDSGARPAHSETIRRRFGGWSAALAAAGLT